MKRILMAVCAIALALVGVAGTGSGAAAEVTAVENCQHHEGDGAVRSAGYVSLYSNPNTCISRSTTTGSTEPHGWACFGAFDDASRCYAEGHTYVTYR